MTVFQPSREKVHQASHLHRPHSPDLVVVESGLQETSGNPGRGIFHFRGQSYDCAIGRNGIIEAGAKTEGDDKTPAGLFAFEWIYYRPDQMAMPESALPSQPITTATGWCDDPADSRYNRAVELPCQASAEKLWRDDGVYDLLLVISHNRAPAAPERGSAIFVHLARPELAPTRGCVALEKEGLQTVCRLLGPKSMIRIEARRN